MGYIRDEENESRTRAQMNLQKAKKFERKTKMYSYTTPDKRITISHRTEEGLRRMKEALGIKDTKE